MKCNQDYKAALSLINLAVDRADDAVAIRKDVIEALSLNPVPELNQFQGYRQNELVEAQARLNKLRRGQALLQAPTETLLIFETEEQSTEADVADAISVNVDDVYACDREQTVFLVDGGNPKNAMVLKLRFQ